MCAKAVPVMYWFRYQKDDNKDGRELTRPNRDLPYLERMARPARWREHFLLARGRGRPRDPGLLGVRQPVRGRPWRSLALAPVRSSCSPLLDGLEGSERLSCAFA